MVISIGYFSVNVLEAMVNAGVEENVAFTKLKESIPSENLRVKRLGNVVSKPIIVGACVSGVLSKTLFCISGVPPEGSTLARQLSIEEHAKFGLMRSMLQPP